LKIKPTNVFDGAVFSGDVFFKFVAYQTLQCCQISCANKHKVENIKQLMQLFIAGKFKPINALVDAVVTTILVPFENQTFRCSQ